MSTGAFCEAMIGIHAEIDKVGGRGPVDDNPRTAPQCLLASDWDHRHTRGTGAYPLGTAFRPRWPAVRRIDGAYEDRNLMFMPAGELCLNALDRPRR